MSREEAERVETMISARPSAPDLDARRAGFEAMAGRFEVPDGVSVQDTDFGGVPGRLVTAPGADPARVFAWLHGGAFTVGSSVSYTELCARLSAASGLAVACPDYRLSPENVYPAALSDAEAAWHALGDGAVALGGDSCGGNLAVALTQRLIAGGGAPPRALYLLSPYLDLTHSGDSVRSRAELDAFVRPETMPATAAAYLGETPADDPGASPLFGEVAGFPPTLIHVGEREVLFDDAKRFHDKLTGAGAKSDLREWPGMLHVFAFFGPWIAEGREATTAAGAFVRARCGARDGARA